MNLGIIRVLWRRPDSMELWGIPYSMRPGQSPRDLYESRRIPDTTSRLSGATMVSPGPREGWLWLGCPGWWGPLGAEEQKAIEAWLAPLRAAGLVPDGPAEWTALPFVNWRDEPGCYQCGTVGESIAVDDSTNRCCDCGTEYAVELRFK